MSAFDSDLERNINELVRAARTPLSRREREAAATALFRLMSARRQATNAFCDFRCAQGGNRSHGRPELNLARASQEAPLWEARERNHARRRGFEALISTNGRRAA